MNYSEAKTLVPSNAELSACFGNQGEPKYCEYWRTRLDTYEIQKHGQSYTCKKKLGAGIWYDVKSD